jgi:hypothetical protein
MNPSIWQRDVSHVTRLIHRFGKKVEGGGEVSGLKSHVYRDSNLRFESEAL